MFGDLPADPCVHCGRCCGEWPRFGLPGRIVRAAKACAAMSSRRTTRESSYLPSLVTRTTRRGGPGTVDRREGGERHEPGDASRGPPPRFPAGSRPDRSDPDAHEVNTVDSTLLACRVPLRGPGRPPGRHRRPRTDVDPRPRRGLPGGAQRPTGHVHRTGAQDRPGGSPPNPRTRMTTRRPDRPRRHGRTRASAYGDPAAVPSAIAPGRAGRSKPGSAGAPAGALTPPSPRS